MSEQEMNQLIADFGDDLYRFCIHLTGNRSQADDLYQDTFVRVIQLRHKLNHSGNIKSYLMGIAVNVWKNCVRKEQRRGRIAPEKVYEDAVNYNAAEAKDPLESYLDGEVQIALWNAVRTLPDKQKIPVLLYYFQSVPVKEIAQILHIPKGTVLSRLAKARQNLKKEMEGYGYEV